MSDLCGVLSSTQTRTYLGPEEVLKGLQGEIEEVLHGISLSAAVLKELYRTYDFCCANMKLFFKVRPGPQNRWRWQCGRVGGSPTLAGGSTTSEADSAFSLSLPLSLSP